MYLIILIVLVIVTGALGAYAGKVQATTLWAGKMTAGREFEKQMPRGFQDAITPKSQDRLNTVLPILLLIILILGSVFVAWYAGVVALTVTTFVYGIAGRFMPDDLEYYVLRLISAMDNREADYRKNNDLMRAEAAHDMAEDLKDVLLLVHGQNMKVPQMREIRNM